MPGAIENPRGVRITDLSFRDIYNLHTQADASYIVSTHLDHIADVFAQEFYTPFPPKIRKIERFGPALRPLINADTKALVMGSGTGRSSLLLAQLGASLVRGIEANPYQVDRSNHIFDEFAQAGFISSETCKSYQGNFFPPDFSVSEQKKWGFLETEPAVFSEVASSDPYERMGMQLSDFNLIFFYPYFAYETELLQLLAERCRPGTIIVNVGPSEKPQLPPNLKKNIEFESKTYGAEQVYEVQSLITDSQ